MRDYTPEQLRKLDGLIEQHVFGHEIVCWDWPCGREPECGTYEASMSQNNGEDFRWFIERGPVYVDPDTSDFWPPSPWPEDTSDIPGLHALVTPAPHYTTCWTHAGLVLEWLGPRVETVCIDAGTETWGVESDKYDVFAPSLTLAICLHALAVAGVDVAKEVGE